MTIEEAIKQKKFKSENHKLIVNLIYTTGLINYKNEQIFKGFGISMQQYNILRILRGQHPNSATIGLLKDRMLDKMPDASRLVDRLVAKDFVYREHSKEDRRQVLVTISEKGLSLLQELEPLVTASEEQITEFLTIEEVNQLNHLLDKLKG